MEQCREEYPIIGFYLSGHPLDNFKYEMQHFTNASCSEIDERNITDKWVDREFRIGGIITESKQGLSARNGDPYGIMTVEDYNGSCTIRLYKGEFLKFKSYFEKDSFVFIKGVVKQYSHTNPDGTLYISKPKMKITEMMLLSDVLEKKTKVVRFNVYLNDITSQFCKDLQTLAKKNPGNALLEAHITDSLSGLTLTMKSRDMKVNPAKIMKALETLHGVHEITPVTAQF